MITASHDSIPHRVATVQAALGRCVLLYQANEQLLKLILPHVRATAREALEIGQVDWRELLDSKKTMGQLVGLLFERTSSTSGESLASWLKTVVAQRNEVIHHFYDQAFASLRTEENAHDAMRFLHDREVAAAHLLKLLQALAQGAFRDDVD